PECAQGVCPELVVAPVAIRTANSNRARRSEEWNENLERSNKPDESRPDAQQSSLELFDGNQINAEENHQHRQILFGEEQAAEADEICLPSLLVYKIDRQRDERNGKGNLVEIELDRLLHSPEK